MKIKPARVRGRVVVELDRKDDQVLAPRGPASRPQLFKIENILVPIDFSDCSKKALNYAIAFAQQFRADLTLVHVVPSNYFVAAEFGMVDYPLLGADLRKGAEVQLAAMVENEVGSRTPVKTVVREGPPVQGIVAVAKDAGADLIILSTHGRTGLKHVFLGSVAENVVRYAPCPVLIVREQEREFLRG